MPRPPKMMALVVRLPRRMHAALHERAVAEETSAAEIIRQAVAAWLKGTPNQG